MKVMTLVSVVVLLSGCGGFDRREDRREERREERRSELQTQQPASMLSATHAALSLS